MVADTFQTLKVMSKRNVSRKDADSQKVFRISIFFEAGGYFLPESYKKLWLRGQPGDLPNRVGVLRIF
jgi:hypothetical protein